MNLSNTIRELLEKRGIRGEEEIEEFLSSKPTKTHSPSLLKDLDAGVDLILSEIEKGSRICVYGDYDADGVTSTALMLSVLRNLIDEKLWNKRLGYYIPSRFDEGYGLNQEAVESIAAEGYNMIITVDCGSVSYDEVELAKSLGLKVLVTDHHSVTDKSAHCLLINPNRPDDTYPFKGLSGCGVAFKLAQGIKQKAGLPNRVLTEVLDLVALGTVGDIMPLLDENRTLVKFGLKVINTDSRKGLKTLIEGAGLKGGGITSENISFVIVPHLNASGRMEDAALAVRLLDGVTAQEEGSDPAEMVEELLYRNRERKRLQQYTYDNCIEDLRWRGAIPDFIVIKSDDAHEGITGIVAGKLKENFYRPAILVTPTGEGRLKGTGRSIDGINLYDLLKEREELFEKFGGHKAACGFTMPEENLGALEQGLLEAMERIKETQPDLFEKKYRVDMTLLPEEVTLAFAEELEQLEPFGNGNPKPVFSVKGLELKDVRYMGDRNQHCRFTVAKGNSSITCVMFNKAEEYRSRMEMGNTLEIIGTLTCQIWQGAKRLQFIINEIKFD